MTDNKTICLSSLFGFLGGFAAATVFHLAASTRNIDDLVKNPDLPAPIASGQQADPPAATISTGDSNTGPLVDLKPCFSALGGVKYTLENGMKLSIKPSAYEVSGVYEGIEFFYIRDMSKKQQVLCLGVGTVNEVFMSDWKDDGRIDHLKEKDKDWCSPVYDEKEIEEYKKRMEKATEVFRLWAGKNIAREIGEAKSRWIKDYGAAWSASSDLLDKYQ